MGGSSTEATLLTLSDQAADPFKTAGVAGGATLRIEDFMASLKKAQPHSRRSYNQRKGLDTEKYVSRLRYLCRLIARDRQGFCPFNGILVVLPITAANPDNRLDELAEACKADLSEAFGVFS